VGPDEAAFAANLHRSRFLSQLSFGNPVNRNNEKGVSPTGPLNFLVAEILLKRPGTRRRIAEKLQFEFIGGVGQKSLDSD
jgi:hypothetical protein